MTPAEPLFLDTNVLVAATDRSRAAHADCVSLLRRGFDGAVALRLSTQVQREYLVVATRPVTQNGLGISPRHALENVALFHQAALLLPETLAAGDRLLALTRARSLRGRRIHDANLVAVALEHGIHLLVTLNPDDFDGFKGISTLSPERALGRAT